MPVILSRVKKNAYYDSVRLMRVATTVQGLPGILDAAIMVGTERNKEFLKGTRLLAAEVQGATANDVFFVVEAENEEAAEKALSVSESILEGSAGVEASRGHRTAYSLESALDILPANVAALSIPGSYVKREAMKCLDRGLHLFIFSDNVPPGDELEIKTKAREKGLLVMGPDCGTAILNGAALGFANRVRRGSIGLIGASGTGIQEVACLIHHLGGGITHAIGTGSNDGSEKIGGTTMVQGIRMLGRDPSTAVIAVISKPPAPSVMARVVEELGNAGKPAAVNFIGAASRRDENGIRFCGDLEQTAVEAVRLAGVKTTPVLMPDKTLQGRISRIIETLPSQRKFVRGIFSGGTFALEAATTLTRIAGKVHTNVAIGEKIAEPRHSLEHSCIDLGDDLFTAGRPHPMLEPAVRNRRIGAELADPETAVVLLDVVLGYGVHRDPAGELTGILQDARKKGIPVVASVCGTDEDPQNRSRQVAKLEDLGVLVFPSNASAVRAAARIALREGK